MGPAQAAAAVALLVVVAAVALWGWLGPGAQLPNADPSMAAGGAVVTAQSPVSVVSRASSVSGDAPSSGYSRAIESWLATLPPEPVVVRVGTRAAVARLEDRIAQVDDLLTAERVEGARPDHLVALQQERVRLVGSLAQVRYAEVVASELP